MQKILALLCLFFSASAVFAHTFNIVSNLEEKKSFSVAEFECMGVQYGFFHYGFPVNLDEQGRPFWSDSKEQEKILAIYEKYRGSSIKLIPVIGIWNLSPDYEGVERQLSVWGQKLKYRCFAGDSAKIEKCLGFLARELAGQPAFGGICLDDEPAIMAGGSFSPAMIGGFEGRYKIAPPTSGDFYDTPKGLIADDHVVLLWLAFQRERQVDFYRRLYLAVQTAVPDCKMYFIPPASWICGKTISLPDSPPANTKSRTLGAMDAYYIRNFQLYTQYAFTFLNADGWGGSFAEGLCQRQFAPPNSPRNVVPIYAPAPDNSGGISVEAFRRYVLQTFAEGAGGIGYWPISVFTPAHIQAAAQMRGDYIQPVCALTGDLRKMPGRMAVLFSTSTAALADLWRNNPIERFKHHHQCDALSYYLLKKGIPFDIVLEQELPQSDLSKYRLVVSAGVDYLTKSGADRLGAYIRKGGSVIFDQDSAVVFDGLRKISFDATAWFRSVVGQYQRESDLRYQCGLLEAALAPHLPDDLAVCRSSSMHLNINYLTDATALYVLLVNDALCGPVKAVLTFDCEYAVTDLLSKIALGNSKELLVTVPENGMLVLRLDKLSGQKEL